MRQLACELQWNRILPASWEEYFSIVLLPERSVQSRLTELGECQRSRVITFNVRYVYNGQRGNTLLHHFIVCTVCQASCIKVAKSCSWCFHFALVVSPDTTVWEYYIGCCFRLSFRSWPMFEIIWVFLVRTIYTAIKGNQRFLMTFNFWRLSLHPLHIQGPTSDHLGRCQFGRRLFCTARRVGWDPGASRHTKRLLCPKPKGTRGRWASHDDSVISSWLQCCFSEYAMADKW